MFFTLETFYWLDWSFLNFEENEKNNNKKTTLELKILENPLTFNSKKICIKEKFRSPTRLIAGIEPLGQLNESSEYGVRRKSGQ